MPVGPSRKPSTAKASKSLFFDIDDLTIMGPVATLRADVERTGLAYELTAELWRLPDTSRLLELSIKCPTLSTPAIRS